MQTLAIWQQCGFLLEGIVGSDDEKHSVEFAVIQHVFRQNQMPHMNGVEGAEKQADISLHLMRIKMLPTGLWPLLWHGRGRR